MKPCSFCGEEKRNCWCGLHDGYDNKPEPKGYVHIIDAEFDEVADSEDVLSGLRRREEIGTGAQPIVRRD